MIKVTEITCLHLMQTLSEALGLYLYGYMRYAAD